jgi:hypothetical protein
MIRKTAIFLILLAGLLLSACVPIVSAETVLELKSDEQWTMMIDLEVTGDQSTILSMGINELLSQSTTELQQKGVTTEYSQEDSKQEGNTIHRLSFSGQGFSVLNETMFGGTNAVSWDPASGEERITFLFDAGQLELPTAMAQSFTLKAGKIVSSNGVQDGSKAVRWDNPSGTLQALMEKPSSFSLGFPNIGIWEIVIILAILLLLGALAVGAFFLIRHLTKKKATSPAAAPEYPPEAANFQAATPIDPQAAMPATPPPGAVSYGEDAGAATSPPAVRPVPDGPPKRRFCPQCGSPQPEEAVFCPNCGRAR